MLKVSEFAKDDEPMAIAAYRFLRDKILTETTTDFAMDFLLSKIKVKYVPFGNWMVRKVIDPMLPEKLLELIYQLILKTGMATHSDFLRMDSPLRGRGL